MGRREIARAWRDEEYRDGLGAGARGALPEHPAGIVEVPDAVLAEISGGATELLATGGCCQGASDTCTAVDTCRNATDTCTFTT